MFALKMLALKMFTLKARHAGHCVTALTLLIFLAACSQTNPPGFTEEPAPVPAAGNGAATDTAADTGPDAGADTAARTPVPIIFDTDLGFDCDDAGALAVLHRLTDRGEAQLLATMSVVGDPQSAGALDVINTYYGRPDIPVGAYQGERWPDARPYWYKTPTDFLAPLVTEYKSSVKDKREVPDAVELYRWILAEQPERSVTIVAVGFSLNLAQLLASSPDANSPLGGRALVAQKVKRLVYMGTKLEEDETKPVRPDFNLGDGPYQDGRNTQKVVATWPTDIVFVGGEIGDSIMTGKSLRAQLPENPVARAYELFPGTNAQGERASWDLTAVLYAVRGPESFWRVSKNEQLEVTDNGVTSWHENTDDSARSNTAQPGRYRLEQLRPDREIEQMLGALLG